MASFNFRRGAAPRPVIAVMPHRPSDVILFPNDSARVPVGPALLATSRTHVGQPGSFGTGQLGNVTSRPDVQDDFYSRTDPEQPQNLQNEAVPSLGPLRTAVMPHRPSEVILFPHDSWGEPPGSFEIGQLGNVTSRPDVQDGPYSRIDPEQLQNLPRREAVSCSPVMRLPPEILARIFELYVACRDECTPVSAQGPSSLTQVCRLWRAIAESDPRLWTFIHLLFSDEHKTREEDVSRIIYVIDLHLQRSGTLPVSFTFADYRGYRATPTGKLIFLIVNRLETHSHRWKRISLDMSCRYFPILLALGPCDFSSLEYLHIIGDEDLATLFVPQLNLQSSTKLKSFAYSRCAYTVEDIINLRWEQLAELSFEFDPHGGVTSLSARRFRYLAQCQNLTTFSLGINQPFQPAPRNESSITLPCLQTLRVRQLHRKSHACAMIDPLILPQLKILEIDASFRVIFPRRRPSSSWHDRNFSHLLARSGCTLHHLSIRDVDFPNDELVRCLALSSMLMSFCFIPFPRSQDIADIIRMMNVERTVPQGVQTASWTRHGQRPIGDTLLVPGLRKITLGTSNEDCLDLMMEMFRSRGGARVRTAGVAALRHVEVVYFDMPHVILDRPGDRVPERVASFRRELAQWVSENEKKREDGLREGERLEASVVVDSPYLVEYINVD